MEKEKKKSKTLDVLALVIISWGVAALYMFVHFVFYEVSYLYLFLIAVPVFVAFYLASSWPKRIVIALTILPVITALVWVDYRSTFHEITLTNTTSQTIQVEIINMHHEEVMASLSIEPEQEGIARFRHAYFRHTKVLVNGKYAHIHDMTALILIDQVDKIEHAGILYESPRIDMTLLSNKKWDLMIVEREAYLELMGDWMDWPVKYPEVRVTPTQPATLPATQADELPSVSFP